MKSLMYSPIFPIFGIRELLTQAAVMIALVSGAAGVRADERPNILWITCEDMSPRLGCYGDNTVPTPNIDRLAAQGVRYKNAYGVYGVCAPNRHALIMGLYPTSTGAMAMRTWKRTAAIDKIKDPELLAIPVYEAVPPAPAKCFTQYLRAAGYYCSNNVKEDYQFRTPVTAWDDSSKTAHWRNRPSPETPFFAVFNFTVTHESGIFEDRSPKAVDPEDVPLPPYFPDTPIVRRDVARHYNNIAVLDKKIATVLSELSEDGLDDNTIVFFFSDHGDGLPRHKRWVYDSGIHVPLIVRFADGRDAGTTTDRLVSFVDFAPTVMSLADLEIPEHMEGRAFLGNAQSEPRTYIYACRDRMDPAPETIRAVRDHRYKYVRNYRPDLPYIGFIPYRDRAGIMQEIHKAAAAGTLADSQWQLRDKTKPDEELYDTQTDPHEVHNLAGDASLAGKLAELRAAHQAWIHEYGDLGQIPESELIKKLWPPDGQQPKTASPKITFKNRVVSIECSTAGASIAWRAEGQEQWNLYVEPIDRKELKQVEAIAHRIGYKPSDVTVRATE